MNQTQIERPPFITVPLADGLKWRGGGDWLYEEKLDGVWAIKEIEILDAVRSGHHFTTVRAGSAFVCGEQMKDGRFFAFDVVKYCGENLRSQPLRERLQLLDWLEKNSPLPLLRPATGHGAEFLETVLARGGEGVVAKFLGAPYGEPWHKCKRVETFDLVVTGKRHPIIKLATVQGEDRGWCCARAAFDTITVGDIVEIAAYALSAKGKLREPRFVRIRNDKSPCK